MPRTTEVEAAAECLRRGGLLAYPTGGVFGLGCDARNEAAIRRLLELKQRPAEYGLIVLVADWALAAPWILPVPPDWAQRRRPGVTWLHPAAAAAPPLLTGHHKTLALRRPAWPPTLALCTAFGAPLVSTSANPRGAPAPLDAAAVEAAFPAGGIDLILDLPCGERRVPSEIRDLVTGRRLR